MAEHDPEWVIIQVDHSLELDCFLVLGEMPLILKCRTMTL